jgi:exosortase
MTAYSRRALQWLPVTLLAAAFLMLYWPVMTDLVWNWSRDSNYSHAFLVLPVSAYLTWLRRSQLAATERRPSAVGLVVVLASLIALLVGTAGVEFFLMRISVVGVATGLVLFLAGWRWLRILLFPLAFTLLMIPIPPVVFFQIAFPLQLLSTRFGVAILQLARIPVLREGNVIALAHTTLEVTEACSGIRSLLSLFTLAVLYGYFASPYRGARIMIALLSVPIAIVANGLRVAGTGIAAQYIGPAAATGFFHEFSGWTVFMTSFAMLIAVASMFKVMTPVLAGKLKAVAP